MRYCMVRSGSSGNCTIVKSKNTTIVVDYGIAIKHLKEGLLSFGVTEENVDAFFFTHSHGDHTSNALRTPLEKRYASKHCLECSENHYLQKFDHLVIGDINITVLPLSHDEECLGFIFDDGEEKLVLVTDTGYVSDGVLKLINDADYYMFEADFDTKMLYQTKRQESLVSRILGDAGHLSNEESAYYLSLVVGKRTKEIFLIHLSQDANTPEIAIETFKKVFRAQKTSYEKIAVSCASRSEMKFGGKLNEEIKI